jgi:thiol-disulfide isomerase/thioredoxin
VPLSRRAFGGSLLGSATLLSTATARADEPETSALDEARRKADALEARVAALEADARDRESLLAMAVGAAPFKPKTLTPGAAGERLPLPAATRVGAPGDRGRKAKLADAVSGRSAAVLVFWATWCKPCTSDAELKHVKDLAGRLEARNVALLNLSTDALPTVLADPRAPTWVYPYWQLEDGHIELLPRSFIERRGMGLPLILVLAPDGAIRWVRDGTLDERVMAELVIAVGLRGR